MENSVRILLKFFESIKKQTSLTEKLSKSTEELLYFKTFVAHKFLKTLLPIRNFYSQLFLDFFLA